jgi:hypothetical protein
MTRKCNTRFQSGTESAKRARLRLLCVYSLLPHKLQVLSRKFATGESIFRQNRIGSVRYHRTSNVVSYLLLGNDRLYLSM